MQFSSPSTEVTPNPSFQGTACKLRSQVRSGLRPPPAPELKR
jgi:hypothetical protein